MNPWRLLRLLIGKGPRPAPLDPVTVHKLEEYERSGRVLDERSQRALDEVRTRIIRAEADNMRRQPGGS